MDGAHGDEHESGALDELLRAPRPLDRLVERERGVREQVLAALVADLPRVERFGPPVHLSPRNALALVDQRCQDPCLANPGRPERQSEAVVVADAFGQRAKGRQTDAEGRRSSAGRFRAATRCGSPDRRSSVRT
jgi:hypothetical protein